MCFFKKYLDSFIWYNWFEIDFSCECINRFLFVFLVVFYCMDTLQLFTYSSNDGYLFPCWSHYKKKKVSCSLEYKSSNFEWAYSFISLEQIHRMDPEELDHMVGAFSS